MKKKKITMLKKIFICLLFSLPVYLNADAFPPIIELSELIDSGNVLVISGIDQGDHVRTVNAAGDINGDGIDDVILGAHYADPNGKIDAGESYIVFGEIGGFSTSTLELSSLNGQNGFIASGIKTGDLSGRWVSGISDFNDDGVDDIVIGAYLTDPYSTADPGQSYVIFGKTGSFPANINLSDLNGTNGFAINGIIAGDNAGHPVSRAGDVNGDGVHDLLIGANLADPNGKASAGESYVIFGTSDSFDAEFELSSLVGTNGFAVYGATAGDELGFSASTAGDFNYDGIDDIIIGAPYADVNSITDAGKTYMIFGSLSGFNSNIGVSELNGTNGFVINGIGTGEASGRSVQSAGDINGDGYDDIVIGAPFANPNGKSDAGKAYIVFGTSTIYASGISLSDLDGTNGFALNGISANDYTGRNVSTAGDINGDGLDDLFIGARGADPDGRVDAGKVYVVFGSDQSYNPVLELADLNGDNGFALHGLDPGDRFGRQSAVAGDINLDGAVDRITCASFADPPYNAGEAYVIFSFDMDNHAPSLEPIGNKQVTEEQTLQFTVTANDIDGDSITLTSTTLPQNAIFDDNGDGTGEFSYSPSIGASVNSPYNITFTVTDMHGASDSETITITVYLEGENGPFQQDGGTNGILSIESENFHNYIPRGIHDWIEITSNQASQNTAMQVLPDDATNITTGYVNSSPRLDFNANFVKTGTHYIWVRGNGLHTGADSLHIGLDGNAVSSSADFKNFLPKAAYVWSNSYGKTITINSPGIHTLNIYMRESGFVFDKIVLTTSSSYIPAGFGPDESPKDILPKVETPVITPNGGNYSSAVEVEIQTSTPGAEIYYTLDGGDPSINSTPYVDSFWISATATLKAIAYLDGYTGSDTAIADFFIETSTGAFQQDGGTNGILSIESENFHNYIPRGIHDWIEITSNQASQNTAMQVLPDDATNITTGYVNSSPRLDFNANFVKTGTHYIWVRGNGLHTGADSLHIGLDGNAVSSSADFKNFLPKAAYVWSNSYGKTITINSPGIHTLNIYMRESGFVFDKIVLTTSSSYIPAGFGPDESPKDILPKVETPVITPNGGNYSSAVEVEIQTSTPGAEIYYTLDGGDPSINSTPYVDSFWISATATLKAIAYLDGYTGSDTAIADFFIETSTGAFQQDGGTNGILSIESENFHNYIPRGIHDWIEITSNQASQNTAMQVLPDDATNITTGYVNSSPRLDFNANFVKTGTHYIWVRGNGLHTGADSLHIGLDGNAVSSSADFKNFLPKAAYVWSNSYGKTITINSPGIHTLNIYMRESGFVFDKIVLTTSSSYIPAGFGPDESPNGTL